MKLQEQERKEKVKETSEFVDLPDAFFEQYGIARIEPLGDFKKARLQRSS